MGKKSDKMYMTATEWKQDFGGAKKKALHTDFKKLPFNCCSISFLPFKIPVCTAKGDIFDLLNIVPWLKKHKTNPLTGEPLASADLVRLNWSKNENGEYHCPITFKTFNDHTHIVAIKKTGNVYDYATIEELNIKSKNWKDLLTDESFTRKDIITLQDPHNLSKRDMNGFDFVKKGLKAMEKGKEEIAQEADPTSNINTVGCISRILNEMANSEAPKSIEVPSSLASISTSKTKSFVEKQSKNKNAQHFSNGLQAYSFTSMAFTPTTSASAALISDEEYLFQHVKEKGQIQMKTNLGDLHFELYCPQAPRACYNMIKHAKAGYYNDVNFHRSIRKFMLQGGDPTGTGSGGESVFGKPFQDEFNSNLNHLSRGMLSMANKGPNTNTSQFFITYAAAPHLNNKHTVFGKLIGGDKVLDLCEAVGTDMADKPITPITVNEIKVITDPFDDVLLKDKRIQEGKIRKIEERELKAKLIQASSGTTLASDKVGKFLPSSTASSSATSSKAPISKQDVEKSIDPFVSIETSSTTNSKKRKAAGTFGGFESW